MIRKTVKARRVRDNKIVEYVRMIPETPEDLEEIERLDREGLIGLGDSFAEQLEHERLTEKRLAEERANVPTD